MKDFDFVFTIRLRDVDTKSSLPEIIRKQHGQLNKLDNVRIKDILEGKSKHKVALLLDGYDEYKKGRNADIDRVIESGVGNCFIILTSRPGFVEAVRDKMDGEITIEGLSIDNIKEFSKLYLGNKNLRRKMLKQAKMAGIYGRLQHHQTHCSRRMRDDAYLSIPIILLLVCTVYDTNHHLSINKADIMKSVYSSFIQKSKGRTSDRKTDNFTENEQTIYKLGKLSWEALQKDEKQFLLNKVECNLYNVNTSHHKKLLYTVCRTHTFLLDAIN